MEGFRLMEERSYRGVNVLSLMGAGTLIDLRSLDGRFYCDHVETIQRAVHNMFRLFMELESNLCIKILPQHGWKT